MIKELWDRDLEKEWRKSLPQYTFRQLVEIFPQAKKYLKQQNERCVEAINRVEEIQDECEEVIYRYSSKENEEFWRMIYTTLFTNDSIIETPKNLPPGIKATVRIINQVKTNIKVATGLWDSKYGKDPADVIKNSPTEWKKVIKRAMNPIDWFLEINNIESFLIHLRLIKDKDKYIKKLAKKYGITDLKVWDEFKKIEIEDNFLLEDPESIIKRNNRVLYKPKKTKGSITEEDIENARKYPIDQITEFKRNRKICYWHKEKNPSLHYFKKTNTVKCFSCGFYGSAIDVYIKEHNVDFISAVKNLI